MEKPQVTYSTLSILETQLEKKPEHFTSKFFLTDHSYPLFYSLTVSESLFTEYCYFFVRSNKKRIIYKNRGEVYSYEIKNVDNSG